MGLIIKGPPSQGFSHHRDPMTAGICTDNQCPSPCPKIITYRFKADHREHQVKILSQDLVRSHREDEGSSFH